MYENLSFAIISKEKYRFNFKNVDYYNDIKEINKETEYDMVFTVLSENQLQVIINYHKEMMFPSQNDYVFVYNVEEYLYGILATANNSESSGLKNSDLVLLYHETKYGEFSTYYYTLRDLDVASKQMVAQAADKLRNAKKAFILFVGEGSAFEFSDAIDTIIEESGRNYDNTLTSYINKKPSGATANKIYLYTVNEKLQIDD